MTETYRIGVIGTGTIAAALVEGIAGDGHTITVSERNAAISANLAARFANVSVAANQQVLEQSEVVFLSLAAEVAETVLAGLTFRPDQRVFSLMVGLHLEQLGALVAPARAEAIVVPFPSVARGGSPVLVHPISKIAAQIFGRRNTVFPVAEAHDLATLLSAQAVLSPALKLVADAAEWASERTGDDAQVEGFLRLLVGGCLMAEPPENAGSLTAMLQALSTPGGLNATLREHMDEAGMPDALRFGLDALEARLKEGG